MANIVLRNVLTFIDDGGELEFTAIDDTSGVLVRVLAYGEAEMELTLDGENVLDLREFLQDHE